MSASISSNPGVPAAKAQQLTEKLENLQLLKDKATKNPALTAICEIFAKRERSRNEITVNAMYVNLIKEGKSFSKGKIGEAFKALASAKVGTLKTDDKGVRALTNINTPLTEIGRVIAGTPERRKAVLQEFVESAPPVIAKLTSNEVYATLTARIGNETAYLLKDEKMDAMSLLVMFSKHFNKKED